MRYAVEAEAGALYHVIDRWQGIIVGSLATLAEANALIFALFDTEGGVTRFRVAIYDADRELLSMQDAGEKYAAAVLVYRKAERASYVADNELSVEMEHYIHGKWAPVGGPQALEAQ